MRFELVILVLLLGISSCSRNKPSDPQPDPTAAAAAQADVSDPAAGIHFQILESGGNYALPGDSAPQSSESLDEAVYSGTEVIFTNVLPFPRTADKDYFIVWSADRFSQSVSSMDYRSDTTDNNLQTSSVAERNLPTYDPLTRRYFISFSELFSGRRTEITASDEQTLTLNIAFQNGTTTTLTLKFRVAGIPPQPVLTSDNIPAMDAGGAGTALAQAQLNVASYHVTNPADRSLRLWVSASSISPETYQSDFAMTRVQTGGITTSNVDTRNIGLPNSSETQPSSPFPATELDRASGPITSFVSLGAATGSASPSIPPVSIPVDSSESYESIILPAGASAEIQIYMGPAGTATVIPSSQTVTLGWDSVLTQTAPLFPMGPMATSILGNPHHTAVFLEKYSPAGVHVTARYDVKALFSEVDESSPPTELPGAERLDAVDLTCGEAVSDSAIPTWNSVVHL